MKLKENVNEIIIIETKSDSNEKECYDIITRKRLWTRNCPDCNKTIYYKEYKCCVRAKELNCLCKSCSRKNITIETRKKRSDSCKKYRKELSHKERENISLSLMKEKNPNWKGGVSLPKYKKCPRCKNGMSPGAKMCVKCQKSDPTYRRKMREIALNRISRLKCNGEPIFPFFNKKACEYFEKLNEQFGNNIRHALNGGEFRFRGYFADGYDMVTNIWYEWDEKHHYDANGILKQRDTDRQNEIMEYLDCKFVRIKEWVEPHKLIPKVSERTVETNETILVVD